MTIEHATQIVSRLPISIRAMYAKAIESRSTDAWRDLAEQMIFAALAAPEPDVAAPVATKPAVRGRRNASIWPAPVVEVTFADGHQVRLSTHSLQKTGPDIERGKRLAQLFYAAELGRECSRRKPVWERPAVPVSSLPAITSARVAS